MKRKILALCLTIIAVLGLTACESGFFDIYDSTGGSHDSGDNSFGNADGGSYNVIYNVYEGSTTPTDLKTVLKTITPSVVEVYISHNDVLTSAGSGVVVGNVDDSEIKKSFIITCHHVIEGAAAEDKVIITTIDGESYYASFVGSDPDSDICVLSIQAVLPPVTYFGDSDKIEVGEDVVAIGNPLGSLGGTVTKGIVSAASREITIGGNEMKVIQTDAAVNSGNSGGGLFTADGYLVGMVNAKYLGTYNSGVEGLAFAIPSNKIREVTEDLIAYGYIPGKYLLGCTVANYYTSKWGSQGYVYVTALDFSGSFYQGGLRVGDILEKMTTYDDDGNATVYDVGMAGAFVEYLNNLPLKVGQTVKFEIRRGTTQIILNIEILQYQYGVL